LYFIEEICSMIIHIDNKKLNYYVGNYDKFLKQSEQDRLKQLKDFKNYEKTIEAMKKNNKDKKTIDSFVKQQNLTRPEKDYEVRIKFLEPNKVKGGVIRLENLGFSFDDKLIFDDVNLEFNYDKRIAIVGENGVGKSTLLKLILKELTPNKGEVIVNSDLKIGYYNQHFEESLPSDMSSVEYLMSLNDDIDITLSHKLLSMFGLEPKHHKVNIGLLSGGQKARVKFASFGIIKPHVLILDEPSNHLDIVTMEAFIEALNSYKGGIVVVSHNYDLVTKINCELLVVEDHDVTFYDGDYDDYVDEIIGEEE
jgi:ATPase subunit of ABC transporter with duplicated ATPase domains